MARDTIMIKMWSRWGDCWGEGGEGRGGKGKGGETTEREKVTQREGTKEEKRQAV